jgi:hypothetical protein
VIINIEELDNVVSAAYQISVVRLDDSAPSQYTDVNSARSTVDRLSSPSPLSVKWLVSAAWEIEKEEARRMV